MNNVNFFENDLFTKGWHLKITNYHENWVNSMEEYFTRIVLHTKLLMII